MRGENDFTYSRRATNVFKCTSYHLLSHNNIPIPQGCEKMAKTQIKIFLLSLAFLSGILYAYHNHTPPIEQCEIITLGEMARPVDAKAIYWMRHYNKNLSEDTASDLFHHIENTVHKYHSDPNYSKGIAPAITPRLVVALILKESGFRWSAISDHGAIGLCQVMPLHIPSLQHLGIESHEDLLNAEKNIEAGIFVLMNYARRVQSIDKALCWYNAGPSKERAGRGYAKAVLGIYRKIGL